MPGTTKLIDDPDFTLHVGDALEVLRGLPAESVHCCVTSPPYWGLRDYGTGSWDGGDPECDHRGYSYPRDRETPGGRGGSMPMSEHVYREKCGKCGATRIDRQLGLEPTPEEYVSSMVSVFREVRRVLRRDGTCWLNLGSSYASGMGGGLQGENGQRASRSFTSEGMGKPVPQGYKPKDMIPTPWLVAMALQADGWYLRSDIIWSKPNPMPESVTDRPTKAHEYLFLLTRSARYFYDADAIREPAEWARWGDQTNGKHEGSGSAAGWIGSRSKADLQRGRTWDERKAEGAPMRYGLDGAAAHGDGGFAVPANGRNRRSVWEIATEPYPDAHFATFPQALVEPCVLAGTSERGCCPECGAPWERETETRPMSEVCVTSDGPKRRGRHDQGLQSDKSGLSPSRVKGMPVGPERTIVGWRPTCDHNDGTGDSTSPNYSAPCTVLDPFLGSGTTALVARRLGRKSIGIELSPQYAQLAARRLQQLSLLAG